MPIVRRALLLIAGCIGVGVGVAMLLVADLGSDGFSTLVNGVAISTGIPFWVSNIIVSASFIGVGALRGVKIRLGALIQMVIVGVTVSVVMSMLSTPEGMVARVALLLAAVLVIAVGITAYLGANLGAGPMEAASLAFDPPFKFKWVFSTIQLLSAVTGWLLGATLGLATIIVIVGLGPLVTLASRVLRLDVHQGDQHVEPVS